MINVLKTYGSNHDGIVFLELASTSYLLKICYRIFLFFVNIGGHSRAYYASGNIYVRTLAFKKTLTERQARFGYYHKIESTVGGYITSYTYIVDDFALFKDVLKHVSVYFACYRNNFRPLTAEYNLIRTNRPRTLKFPSLTFDRVPPHIKIQ